MKTKVTGASSLGLIVLAYMFITVSGGELTLNSSLPYAVVDNVFTINCMSTEREEAGITWRQQNGFSVFLDTNNCTTVVLNLRFECTSLQNYSLTFPSSDIISFHDTEWECSNKENRSNLYKIYVHVPVTTISLSINGNDIGEEPVWIRANYLANFSCETSPSRPVANVSVMYQSSVISSPMKIEETPANSGLFISSLSFDRVPGTNIKEFVVNCTAVHDDAVVFTVASISVYYPPTQPQVIVSRSFPWYSGDTESLTCQSTPGHPSNSTYIWMANNISLSQENRQDLTIYLTPEHHDRKYSCLTTNGLADSSTSADVRLTVYYPPGQPKITTSSMPWKEGENKTLTCTSSPGNPIQTYYWIKDDSVTSSGSSPVLNLPNLERTDDGGNYSCRVSNAFTTVKGWSNLTSTVLQLHVQYAPHVTISGPTLLSSGGNNGQFTCQADGNPNTYTYREWEHFVGSTLVRKFSSRANISLGTVSYEDTGIYKCHVENGITDVTNNLIQTASKNVSVNAPPVILPIGSQYVCNEGNYLSISGSFYSLPKWNVAQINHNNDVTPLSPYQYPASVTFHNVNVVVTGYRFTYRTNVCSKTYNGSHLIRIQNSQGTSEKEIVILYSGKPEVPFQFVSESSGSNSLILRWSPGYDGGHTQTFVLTYRGEKYPTLQTKETTETSVEIDDLQPDTAYIFWILSKNSKGVSANSSESPLIVTTLPISGTQSNSLNTASIVVLAIGLILAIIATVLIIWNFRKRIRNLCGTRSKNESSAKGTTNEHTYVNQSFTKPATSSNYENTADPHIQDKTIESIEEEKPGQHYEPLGKTDDRLYDGLNINKEKGKKREQMRKKQNLVEESILKQQNKHLYQNVKH